MVPRGSAFQMMLRVDCISVNTPDAVMIRVIRPIIVAKKPVVLVAALWIAVWRRSALWRPIRPPSCSAMAPRAASSPNASPAMATTMNSTGPIEVTV